jgi:hypothetical protein
MGPGSQDNHPVDKSYISIMKEFRDIPYPFIGGKTMNFKN